MLKETFIRLSDFRKEIIENFDSKKVYLVLKRGKPFLYCISPEKYNELAEKAEKYDDLQKDNSLEKPIFPNGFIDQVFSKDHGKPNE